MSVVFQNWRWRSNRRCFPQATAGVIYRTERFGLKSLRFCWLLGLGDRAEIQPGALFLVLSQGDHYWGRPEPVISFRQRTKGQASYCGWLMYPLSNAGGEGVIASLHSSKLQSNGPLTLNRVKEAVGETRYDPDLYGKRRR